MLRKNFPRRREQRRTEAVARQETAEKRAMTLGRKAQFSRLDLRGERALKERKRLEKARG